MNVELSVEDLGAILGALNAVAISGRKDRVFVANLEARLEEALKPKEEVK